MFLLYFTWSIIYFVLSYTHTFIEQNFFIKNNPFLIRKRTFKYLSYFEKILLILFYKKGWFEKSISNLYRKKDIIEYRRNFYPIIYSFHLNYNKVNYNYKNLNFLVKQYNYFFKKSLFKKKLNKIFVICYNKNNSVFIKYLMLQNLYFKKYYNLNSYYFFKQDKELNLIKFNRLFNIFLIKSSKKLLNLNLDVWYDWYEYNFNKNIIKYYNVNNKLTKQQKKNISEFKKKKLNKWIKTIFNYKNKLYNVNLFFNKKFKGIIFFKFNLNNFFKIIFNKNFEKITKYYTIKFSESSVSKYINTKNIKNYNIQYLRKNRIFNKGRYSRNRQLYRTGVYWCLWLNIIMVYGLYFMFYRFTFNFGYFWWGVLFLCYSTIFSRVVKYNFHNLIYIYNEIINLVKWYGFIFNNFNILIINYLKKYFVDFNKYNYMYEYKNSKINFIYYNLNYYFFKFYKNFFINNNVKIGYIWQGMKKKDKSFFKYKTFLHWIKELWRLIIFN